MSKKTFLQKAIAALLLVGACFLNQGFAATVTCVASGSWNSTGTWDLGPGETPRVPAAGDDVVINFYTVTLDVSPSVASLLVTGGGSLVGTGNVDITGLLKVQVGTLNNIGNITAGSLELNYAGAVVGGIGATGTISISGQATLGSSILSGKTVVLNGNTTKVNGFMYIQYGAILRNLGTFTLANTFYTDFNGNDVSPGTIDNQGTIIKDPTAFSFLFFERIIFNNSGTLQIDQGDIYLQGHVATGGNFTNGSVILGSGASLRTEGYSGATPNYAFSGGTVTGTGKLVVGLSSQATFSGSATFLANIETVNDGKIVDNVGIAPASLKLPSGTYRGLGGPSISGNLTLSGGTFDPDGAATIGGALEWTKGNVGSTSTAISSGSVTVNGGVNITTSNAHDLYKKNLICQGGANCNASVIDFHGATMTIPSGQVFDCSTQTGEAKIGHQDGGTLIIAGTFNKTGTDNTKTLRMKELQIINTGAMNFLEGLSQFTGDNDINHTGNGSITIGSGATLKRGGSGNNPLVYKNALFTNNGTLELINLSFEGTSQQTLAGMGTLSKLTLNNANGLDILDKQTVTDGIVLNVSGGKILLHDGDLNVTNAQVLNASSTNYVVTLGQGRLMMPVTSTKIFDVGPSASSYNPVTITPLASGLSFGIRVRAGFDPGMQPTENSYVNRQWQVDRGSPSELGNANLTFQWNTGDVIGNNFLIGNCHVSHWDGMWQSLGDGAGSCGSVCSRTQLAVSDFSPFDIASGTPLPIELAEFRGFEIGQNNQLEWVTASESGTKSHFLQRSKDGISDWEVIAERDAAGISAVPVFYSAMDSAPLPEAYYRVFFEDWDGKREASPLVFIKRKNVPDGLYSVYPNPIGVDGFWLRADPGIVGQPLTISIFDAVGSLMVQKSFESAIEKNFFTIDEKLPAGAYFLKIASGASVQNLTLMVK